MYKTRVFKVLGLVSDNFFILTYPAKGMTWATQIIVHFADSNTKSHETVLYNFFREKILPCKGKQN